MTQRW